MKMTYDNLVLFQRWIAKEYPYYPIKQEDWNKINELNITALGLEQLTILKRQIVMGVYTLEDIALFVRLLELYASTNPSHERLRDYKKYHDLYFTKLMTTYWQPDLIKEGLAVKNLKYNPKFRKKWNVWGTNLIHKCHRLRKHKWSHSIK